MNWNAEQRNSFLFGNWSIHLQSFFSSIPGVEEGGGTLMNSDDCDCFKYILLQEEHRMLMLYLKKSLLAEWTSFNFGRMKISDNIFHHMNNLEKSYNHITDYAVKWRIVDYHSYLYHPRDRLNPSFFKFQFKNVEYSSGRNKTFLCYQVDIKGDAAQPDSLQGYLEDEHSGAHAEEAFFQQVLPQYNKSLQYTVTWYISASPCVACAAKLGEILKARKTLRLNLHCSRLFLWEEPEIQAGLKALAKAGCKLRMMRPVDFSYVWSTFVENEEDSFTPWEDCQESYEYYDEKLTNILQ